MGLAVQYYLSRPSSFCGVEKAFRLDVMQTFNNVQMNGWSCSTIHGPVHLRCWKSFLFGSYEAFQKHLSLRLGRAFQNAAQLISRRWNVISSRCYADFQQRSTERLVVLSQTRSSSFHGVKEVSRLDDMKLFNNIRTDGWAVHPQTHPSFFTVLKNFFVWVFCSHLKTFKFIAGPRSPTSSVTAQLIPRRCKMVSSWSYADFQHRSNERMVVLPQTPSRSFHGVEKVFHVDGMKVFKNVPTYGWAVLPQTRPSSFHGVGKPFRLMLCSYVKTFKFMAGSRSSPSPVTVQLISRRWRFVSSWCYADFQLRSNERLVVLPQKRSS